MIEVLSVILWLVIFVIFANLVVLGVMIFMHNHYERSAKWRANKRRPGYITKQNGSYRRGR